MTFNLSPGSSDLAWEGASESWRVEREGQMKWAESLPHVSEAAEISPYVHRICNYSNLCFELDRTML